MSTFTQQFIPYQLWRYVRMNVKIYLLAKGFIGPAHVPEATSTIPEASATKV
jgi:hypothetical protein